ncbi:MAG: hypothetical protein FWF06_05550 [Symbiobacteriaceae bacterium]|nr:hypothetical protein [Symbiobacteriaceae bacterium]
MKRTLPLVLGFGAGLVMLLDSFFNIPFVNNLAQRYFMRSITVSVAWAVGIGSLNLLRIHFRNISQRRTNWMFSAWLVFVFGFMAFSGFFLVGHNQNPFYTFFYSSLQQNLSSTVYALNAYYMVSACYRSFRVRSMEAGALLVVAIIVMIGSVPLGAYIWGGFPLLQDWISKMVNDAAVRAMSIGVTLGSLSQSMRNLVGVERSYLGGEE